MKRFVILTIPFLVLIMVGAITAHFEGQRTPDWETELNQYLIDYSSPTNQLLVREVVAAKRPFAFKATMGQVIHNGWPWGIQVLPYPPSRLHCVLVEIVDSTAVAQEEVPGQRIIYIGYHSDAVWRSGWLLHEGPHSPFPPETDSNLAAIGCDFEMTE